MQSLKHINRFQKWDFFSQNHLECCFLCCYCSLLLYLPILVWGLFFALFVASPLDCSPSFYPYTIEIVYRSEAAAQSLQVYQYRNSSFAFVTSMYGYRKDYRVDTELICVDHHYYQFICSSTFAFVSVLIIELRMLGIRNHFLQ